MIFCIELHMGSIVVELNGLLKCWYTLLFNVNVKDDNETTSRLWCCQ